MLSNEQLDQLVEQLQERRLRRWKQYEAQAAEAKATSSLQGKIKIDKKMLQIQKKHTKLVADLEAFEKLILDMRALRLQYED
jgi:hypothetical protein